MARGLNKIIDTTAKILSFPSVAMHKRRGGKADRARKAVRMARETRSVPATPKTQQGRAILSARSIAAGEKYKVKKRRNARRNSK